jgi:hypothetical protein
MLALRYVYLLALVLWLGGMVVLGAFVAPTTFEVLQASSPENGRALAAAVFGATIGRFHYLSYACGAILLVSLAVMALLGPRPTGFAIRVTLVLVMLGIALYSGLVILADMDGIQQQAGTLPSRLSPGDPRRLRFDLLHLLSTRLMMVNVAGALVLLFWEARDHGR